GSKMMETEKGSVMMDVPVILENDRIYIPVRWVCEAFNLKVAWIDKSQTVVIQN
ncbi:MAG: stalk domain-containing protein, partial [Desulfocucumaceae bacterium]